MSLPDGTPVIQSSTLVWPIFPTVIDLHLVGESGATVEILIGDESKGTTVLGDEATTFRIRPSGTQIARDDEVRVRYVATSPDGTTAVGDWYAIPLWSLEPGIGDASSAADANVGSADTPPPSE